MKKKKKSDQVKIRTPSEFQQIVLCNYLLLMS